ncbi:MAG: hypothetical protein KHX20_03380 [Megasphaera sp.]|nr:hypothetical protein [Megasphaera sp.]
MDATPCEWVPNQIWHLHLAIDDATGFPVDAYFDTQETLNRYYHLLYQTLVDYGIPYEISPISVRSLTINAKKSPSIDEIGL